MATPIPLPVIPIPEQDQPLFTAINEFAKAYMSQPHYDGSHDYQHILRVLSNTNTIFAKETSVGSSVNYDATALFLAALLHDVGDRKYVQPGDGIDPVASILIKHGASSELAVKVQTIVTNVSYSNEIKNPKSMKEALAKYPELAIIQDADRLDAIGAVGLGRVFAYGGAKYSHLPMTRSVSHFQEKLYKLESMMKTRLVEMAKSRNKILKDFEIEWNKESTLSFEFQQD